MKTLLTLALTSHLVDMQPVSPLVWKTLRELIDTNNQDEIVRFAKSQFSPRDAEAVEARLTAMPEIETALEELNLRQIAVISEFDSNYPALWTAKLGGRAPTHLYVAGNADLLSRAMIGVVGSRDIDSMGSAYAQEVAQVAVTSGYGVVSGGARGVDRLAMNAAFEAGGETLGILADSLLAATQESEKVGAFDYGRTCLCSPYLPTAGFQVGHAMARNKLIYALSQATVVVSAAEGTGGTWAGAIEALEHRYCHVLVRDGVDIPSGNKKLIESGAHPLSTPERLIESIEASEPHQGTLF